MAQWTPLLVLSVGASGLVVGVRTLAVAAASLVVVGLVTLGAGWRVRIGFPSGSPMCMGPGANTTDTERCRWC